jgi:hypothetical protein
MTSPPSRFLLQLRIWFAASVTMLLLAACGGGGGEEGAGRLFGPPGNATLQGTWQLSVEVDGVPAPPVTVEASVVPTAEMVAQFDTPAVAQQVGIATFQGRVVTVSGSTLRVTDAEINNNTNYVLVINSFTASDYQGCGSCGVGSTVSFTLTLDVSESGVIDGVTVPAATGTMVVRFRYLRTA